MRVDPASFRVSQPTGFLVVDGVNGAGKGTLLESITGFLQSRCISAVSTREPGGTPLGTALRSLLLGASGESRSPLTELFLFAADRNHHVNTKIRPALKQGNRVISDRYYYSTIAFQGYGRGLDIAMVTKINQIAIEGTLPDAVILLDLDPVAGLRRAASRAPGNAERDSFEEEALAFHHRLRHGFLDLADRLPEPFMVIDASRSPEEIFSAILPFLEDWISRPLNHLTETKPA